MASNQPSRGASVAERRASAALRQQQSRPASAATDRLRNTSNDSRAGSQASQVRKITTTTTETSTRRRALEQEATLRRTKAPLPTTQPPERRRSPRPEAEEVKRKSVISQKPEASIPSTSQIWSPTATLLSPTPNQAPLASRVSIPPQAKHAPTTLSPSPMAGLNLDEQEKALIDDLLFVLLGFEGQYITYSSDRSRSLEPYNPFDEKSRLTGPNYAIASGVDPSLRDLALQILRTATHASALEAFCEVMSRDDNGSVSHALCAAIRRLQKDFLVLVAQLENQYLTNEGFSLHQMSLYLKKSAHVMSQLYALAQEVLTENALIGDPVEEEDEDDDDEDDFENVLASLKEGPGASSKEKKSCIGGALLSLLTRRLQAMSGDPQAKELLSSLLKDASKPYVRMLNEWLHHGNVKDPHQEFMVKEAKSIKRELLEQDYTDEYWEKRYTLRLDLVPPQLEGVRDRVLLAGKYLNVVRECSSVAIFSTTFNTDLSSTVGIPHDVFDMNLIANVNQAYTNANAALMRLLLTTHQLPQRLSSLKHYFFLDRSDWFTYFLELSQSELRKSARSANVGKLQSLLDLVLHTPGSVAAEDPFKEDVKVNMADTGLVGWLMRVVNVQGMDADTTSMNNSYMPTNNESVNGKDEKEISAHEALTLDFGVPFPLSLIISRVTLTRYQLLFRYLLSLKHLEGQLVNSWCDAGGIGSAKRDMGSSRGSKPVRDVGVWRRKTGNPKIELWKKRAWCLR
jgi:gamma-tubulin complex component 2